MTNCLSFYLSSNGDMGKELEIIGAIACSIFGLVTLLGNGMFIFLLMKDPRTLKPMNYYLLSDCATNVLCGLEMVGLSIALLTTDVVRSCLCQYVLEAMSVMVLVTGFSSIAIIAVERYRSLIWLQPPYPLWKRCIVIMCVWVIALGFVCIRICLFDHITCSSKMEALRYLITILFFCFYLLPLGIAIYLYSYVIQKLRATQEIGSIHNQERKKHAIKLMICLLIVFAVCWLPFFSVRLCRLWSSSQDTYDIWLLALHVFGCCQSTLSVVTHSYYSKEFRETICSLCRKRHLFLTVHPRPQAKPIQPWVVECIE